MFSTLEQHRHHTIQHNTLHNSWIIVENYGMPVAIAMVRTRFRYSKIIATINHIIQSNTSLVHQLYYTFPSKYIKFTQNLSDCHTPSNLLKTNPLSILMSSVPYSLVTSLFTLSFSLKSKIDNDNKTKHFILGFQRKLLTTEDLLRKMPALPKE